MDLNKVDFDKLKELQGQLEEVVKKRDEANEIYKSLSDIQMNLLEEAKASGKDSLQETVWIAKWESGEKDRQIAADHILACMQEENRLLRKMQEVWDAAE